MMRRSVFGWAILVSATFSAAAEDLASAQNKVIDAWAGTKSVSAKVTKKVDMVAGNGNRIRSDGKGTYEMARDGNKVRFRLETESETAIRIKDSEKDMKLPAKALIVDDGEWYYSLQSAMGRPNAFREKSEGARRDAAVNDRKALFDLLARDNEMTLGKDDKVAGTDCYVFDAKPKPGKSAGPHVKVLYAFAKDSGMLVKIAKLNDKGEEIETEIYGDAKINEKIDPKRFVFEAPEGVQVKDRSAGPMQVPPASGPAASKPAIAPPASAPASAPAAKP